MGTWLETLSGGAEERSPSCLLFAPGHRASGRQQMLEEWRAKQKEQTVDEEPTLLGNY